MPAAWYRYVHDKHVYSTKDTKAAAADAHARYRLSLAQGVGTVVAVLLGYVDSGYSAKPSLALRSLPTVRQDDHCHGLVPPPWVVDRMAASRVAFGALVGPSISAATAS